MASFCHSCLTTHPHSPPPSCPTCGDTYLDSLPDYVVSAEWDNVLPGGTETVDVVLSEHDTFCEALAAYDQARRSVLADRFYLDDPTRCMATHPAISDTDFASSHDAGEEIRF